MKILLVTWACDRDDISEPLITYRWVREISKRHDVTLFSTSRPNRLGCIKEQFPDLSVIEWCDTKVPFYLERFRAIVKPGFFFNFRKMRRLIRSLLERQHFDIIHHLSPFAWRYASPAYGLGVPLVRGPIAGGLPTPPPLAPEVKEGFHPYKFLRKSDWLRKRFDRNLINSYKLTDCVIAAAPYVMDLLSPLPIKRCEIEVELGLEFKDNIVFMEPLSSGRDENIKLLFVGRVIRTKGVRDAIRAIVSMKTKDIVHFSIIGDGEDLNSCRQEARQLSLQDVVTFRGWCSSEQVEQAYREADIFLFPSFREPTGGVLLEAMTHGLPIVTGDYGGPAYLVNSSYGIKVPPAVPEEYSRLLAENLDRLVENKDLRKEMGQEAMRYAYKNFNWNDKMARLDSIYDSLVSS